MLNVLFVQPEQLDRVSYTGALAQVQKSWSLGWCSSAGASVFEHLATNPADVIVVDGQIGDLVSIDFHRQLKERHPNLVRIVIATDKAQEFSLRSALSAHQFVSSPVSPKELVDVVTRACSLRDFVRSKSVLKIVSQVKRLPTLPDNYHRINELLQRDDVTMEDIAGVIQRDVAMVAKILQISNSTLFGARRKPVSTVQSGVKMLGVTNLKLLVLAVEVFSQFDVETTQYFNLEVLWEHSMRVGALAAEIAKSLSGDREFVSDALAAGMIHDVGKLILVKHLSEEVRHAVNLVKERKLSLVAAEHEVFGATHAEVGGYLLGAWGLPQAIVEAVAYHHAPRSCFRQEVSPLTAVYVANILDKARHGQPELLSSDELVMYAQKLSLEQQLAKWQQLTVGSD